MTACTYSRQAEIQELTSKGILPMQHDMELLEKKGELEPEKMIEMFPLLVSECQWSSAK